MRKYLYCENGFVEKSQWMPNCWVNVECPDQSDFEFLTKELKVPETFLEDIADMDERPRTDTEDNWLLTIIRLSGNFWLVSFKISYLCLPLFYETRTTPSCHPSGCAYRQL